MLLQVDVPPSTLTLCSCSSNRDPELNIFNTNLSFATKINLWSNYYNFSDLLCPFLTTQQCYFQCIRMLEASYLYLDASEGIGLQSSSNSHKVNYRYFFFNVCLDWILQVVWKWRMFLHHFEQFTRLKFIRPLSQLLLPLLKKQEDDSVWWHFNVSTSLRKTKYYGTHSRCHRRQSRAMLEEALTGLQSHPGCVGFNNIGQVKIKSNTVTNLLIPRNLF